jgi:pimeloyl-[acyl-carrier protein] methyl ester esterase
MTSIRFIPGFGTDSSVWDRQINLIHNDINPEIIIAWSMGGFEAFQLIKHEPGKLKALILVSAFPKFIQTNDYPCGTPLALLRNLERKIEKDYLEGLKFFNSLILNQPSHEFHIPKHLTKEMLLSDLNRLKTEDYREVLSSINIPVLIIHGKNDKIASVENALYLSKHIPQSKILLFDGCGHAPFIEDKHRFEEETKKFIDSL